MYLHVPSVTSNTILFPRAEHACMFFNSSNVIFFKCLYFLSAPNVQLMFISFIVVVVVGGGGALLCVLLQMSMFDVLSA